MRSNLMKTSLGVLALGLTATGAQAGWDRDGYGPSSYAYRQTAVYSQQINARQQRQMERIHAGMHEGRLTRAEFHELRDEQREIRAMERHFRADGIIDAREFKRIDRALDVASRNIRAEKHDHQARHAYNPTPWYN